MPTPDLDAAEHFLAAHARVLDRRRFAHLFRDGPAEAVRDAVAAYRNADGGFGHALEPDGRGPESQPAAVEAALRVLDEAGAWDPELVGGACDWLGSIAPREGGAPFVMPGVEGWPHAPWWRVDEGLPASVITTGQIAGTLLRRRVEHPWLDQATEWLWRRAEDPGVPESSPSAGYQVLGLVRFLDHVPDAERADAALDGLADHIAAVVRSDPAAEGELQSPLDLAPEPRSRVRRLLDDDLVAAHLDALAAGAGRDGGWTFPWPAWSPAAEADWRGAVTVDALVVLRANARPA
jgi:hypothetical protein